MKSTENIAVAAGRTLTAYELWYGRNEPPPQRIALRAGPLTAFMEGADLRDLRWRGVEIVRRLYFALRDENWTPSRPSWRTSPSMLCKHLPDCVRRPPSQSRHRFSLACNHSRSTERKHHLHHERPG